METTLQIGVKLGEVFGNLAQPLFQPVKHYLEALGEKVTQVWKTFKS